MNHRTRRLRHLPNDFGALREAAAAEGFQFLDRLANQWRNGRYRGDARATLWAVEDGGALIAIGAQTEDDYDPSPDHRRIRHFYVLPRYRRRGVGRGLAMRLIEDGFARAPRLHLRATHALSIAFWDALGFARIAHESRTHEMVRP